VALQGAVIDVRGTNATTDQHNTSGATAFGPIFAATRPPRTHQLWAPREPQRPTPAHITMQPGTRHLCVTITTPLLVKEFLDPSRPSCSSFLYLTTMHPLSRQCRCANVNSIISAVAHANPHLPQRQPPRGHFQMMQRRTNAGILSESTRAPG